MGALDDLDDIFGSDPSQFDGEGVDVTVEARTSDEMPSILRLMLDEKGPAGNPRWPRLHDLVEGRPAKRLKDPDNESDRDFHIGLDVARWLHGRSIALNGSGERVLGLDVVEDEAEIAQAIADVISYCRAQREDAKGKANDSRYLGLTAARVIQCVRARIEDARRRGGDPKANSGEKGEGSEHPWDEPVDLGVGLPPRFPLHALPEPLRRAVHDVSRELGSVPDIAAAIAIAACSFATSRLVSVQMSQSHVEPTNLWMLLLTPPGGGKTPQQKKLMGAIRRWVREEVERIAAEIRADQIDYDQTKVELEKESKEIAGMKPEDRAKRRPAHMERREAFEARTRPEVPRFIVGDFSESALAGVAAASGGSIFIMDDEGATIWQSLSGRYAGDGASQASLAAKLWAGAYHDEARQTRASHNLTEENIAAMLCPIQPRVLSETKNLRQLMAQGVLDRFAVHSAPVTPVPAEPPVSDGAGLAAYEQALDALLRLRRYQPRGLDDARGLTLSADARIARKAFIEAVNQRVIDGDLAWFSGAVAKLRANVERLSGIFHMVQFPTEQAYRVSISGETMAMAIEVGWYWLDQMLAVQHEIDTPPAELLAERLLRWIERQVPRGLVKEGRFLKRAAQQGLKGGGSTSARSGDIEAAIDVLVDRGFIRRVKDWPVTLAVNPIWLDNLNPQSARNAPPSPPNWNDGAPSDFDSGELGEDSEAIGDEAA